MISDRDGHATLFLFDDAVVGSDFSFFVQEDGGELMGAFFEVGGEGDVGVFCADGFCFELFAVDTKGGCRDGKGLADIFAEGFGGSWNAFASGQSGGDGVVRFGWPAAGRDFVGAIGDDFYGPVTVMFLLSGGFFLVVGISSADVALVPRRSGIEPVVCGEGGDGIVGVAEIDFGRLGEGG